MDEQYNAAHTAHILLKFSTVNQANKNFFFFFLIITLTTKFDVDQWLAQNLIKMWTSMEIAKCRTLFRCTISHKYAVLMRCLLPMFFFFLQTLVYLHSYLFSVVKPFVIFKWSTTSLKLLTMYLLGIHCRPHICMFMWRDYKKKKNKKNYFPITLALLLLLLFFLLPNVQSSMHTLSSHEYHKM